MQDDKNLTLQECLNQPTKFKYFPDLQLKKKKECKTLSIEDFDLLMYNKERALNMYSAFVLYGLYYLGHATREMITMWIQIYKKIYPEKEIPDWNMQTMRKTLVKLASFGLVYSQEYTTGNGTTIVIHTCTYRGYIFFKNVLDKSYLSYDINMLTHAEVETFKRMSISSIWLSFIKENNCMAACCGDKMLFGEQVKTKSRYYAFAWCMMEINGCKKIYVFEPLYFSVNKKVISDEENLQKIHMRLSQLQSYIRGLKENFNLPVIPVFCVEDMDGLKRFCSIIKNQDTNYIYQNALYTSENIDFEMKKNLDKIFMRLSFAKDDSGNKIVKLHSVGAEWINT